MEEDENKTGVQGKFPSNPNSDNQNAKQKNVSCFTRVVTGAVKQKEITIES